MTVSRLYDGRLRGGPEALVVVHILILLSLEEDYILPAVDLFKALCSAHPIPFVCELSFVPYPL